MGQRWTEDEIERLRELCDVAMTWAQRGEALGRSSRSVRSKARRLGLTAVEIPPNFWTTTEAQQSADEVMKAEAVAAESYEPQFLDKKTVPPPDWRRIVAHAEATQQLHEQADPSQQIASIRLPTDIPPIAVFSADWHLGSGAVDYAAWRAHIESILDNDNVYLVDLGDKLENMRTFRNLKAVLDQVLAPQQQWRLLEGVVMELCDKSKYLVSGGGNHDLEFDERIFGEALLSYLYRSAGCVFFENRLLLRMLVGQHEHPHLLFHKSRFRSFLRACHGNMREYQISFPARVVAGAHDHRPGIELYYHYGLAARAGYPFGGKSWLLKCGTFSAGDYGWRYFADTAAIMPTVIYLPGGDVLAFDSLRAALTFRRGFLAERE
jgi:hypothetical protein